MIDDSEIERALKARQDKEEAFRIVLWAGLLIVVGLSVAVIVR